jgi:undecaprenyl-diphosphatase
MDILIVILLALVQALTEFLPISSSGHLALAGFFFGWDYQGLVMDLAVHLGTLVAVVLYFRDDLLRIARALLAIRPGRPLDAEQRLGLGIGIATVPAALVGVSMTDAFAESLRHPLLIAATTAGFALVLWWADARRRGARDEYAVGIGGALFAGAMQALALVPGVSRSGITMTAALMLGLTRTAAARYAFLMSIPITALATAHGVKEVITGESPVVAETFLAAAVLSGVFAFVVIHWFLRFVQRVGVMPFVVYRLLFAAVVVPLWFAR